MTEDAARYRLLTTTAGASIRPLCTVVGIATAVLLSVALIVAGQ